MAVQSSGQCQSSGQYQTLGPWQSLREEMDRLFGDFYPPGARRPALDASRGAPALSAWETAQDLHLEAELPGLRQEDLEVEVVGNQLTLRGQRRETLIEGATFHRRERSLGAFQRSVRLPVEIDADRVQATLTDGVLHLTLPKAAAARPRKIEVKVG